MKPSGWINTGLRPRFFFLDIGAAIVLPALIFYPRMSTIYLVLASFAVFIFLERRGLLPLTLLSILRIRLGNLFRWPIHVTRKSYYHRH